MNVPRRVRQLVDSDLRRQQTLGGSGSLVLIIGCLLAVPPLVVLPEPWGKIGAAAAAILWFGFVGWRALRLLKAEGIRGDRAYDRTLRPMLSKEYQSTESATATRQRKRREDAPKAS